MNYLKYNVFSLFILITMMCGCAEIDSASDYRVQCGCGQTQSALIVNDGDEYMAEEWPTNETSCNDLAKQLVGKWTGMGDSSDRRIVMEEDGSYRLLERRGSKWVRISEGEYWVEYEITQNGRHTELHMTIPDSDEYVVRYYTVENELHLEEPTDSEPEMVFARKI